MMAASIFDSSRGYRRWWNHCATRCRYGLLGSAPTFNEVDNLVRWRRTPRRGRPVTIPCKFTNDDRVSSITVVHLLKGRATSGVCGLTSECCQESDTKEHRSHEDRREDSSFENVSNHDCFFPPGQVSSKVEVEDFDKTKSVMSGFVRAMHISDWVTRCQRTKISSWTYRWSRLGLLRINVPTLTSFSHNLRV